MKYSKYGKPIEFGYRFAGFRLSSALCKKKHRGDCLHVKARKRDETMNIKHK